MCKPAWRKRRSVEVLDSEGIRMTGCNVATMSRYLKSLGVFGVLASMISPVRASWADACLVIHLDSGKGGDAETERLVDLVYSEYRPTPILTPWNGGGGFVAGGGKPNDVLRRLENSGHPQLEGYAEAIRRTREILSLLLHRGSPVANEAGEISSVVKSLPDKVWQDVKLSILKACRNYLPDGAVPALDSMYAVSAGKPGYNPLLGSGGNDGNLEFVDNFRQNLLRALVDDSENLSKKRLRGSLFGGDTDLVKSAMGQFDPGSMFGPNMTETDIGGTSLINPWDYILMIEGAVLFAGGVTRHLAIESRARASFPFVVESSNAGYGTAGGDEKTRGEVWVPVWDRPSTLGEIRHMFGEARAQIGSRRATRGSDVARAIIALGTERGLSRFYRFGIHERNGRSNIVLPMGSIAASKRPRGMILSDLDGWMDRVQQAKNRPASVISGIGSVEDAIFKMAEDNDSDGDGRPDLMQKILVAVGNLEMALGRSYSSGGDPSNPVPLPHLSDAWIESCNDNTAEFRLAASISSIMQNNGAGPIRTNIEPIVYDDKGGVRWLHGSASFVPREAHFGRYASSILQRRMIEAAMSKAKHAPTQGSITAPLPDVVEFLHGRLDSAKIAELAVPLSLVKYDRTKHYPWKKDVWKNNDVAVPYSYAMLKLVFLGNDFGKIHIPYETSLVNLLEAGRLGDALNVARKRLFASGVGPAAYTRDGSFAAAGVPSYMAQNLAPAMLFPLANYDGDKLNRAIGGGGDNTLQDGEDGPA